LRAHPDSSMQERKLRKWLGRAFGSYNRMRTGKTVEVETKEHQKVWGNRNMVKEMPEMPNESEKLTWIREAIEEVKKKLQKEEDQRKYDRIKTWRRRMQDSVSEVGRWLRSKRQRPGITIAGASTRQEGFEAIRKHWKEVWTTGREHMNDDDIAQLAEEMARHVPTVPIKGRTPTTKELLAAAHRGAGKAGGLDGWSGDEVSHVPLPAWQRFNRMVKRWESSKQVPDVLKMSRMLNLAKENKIKNATVKAAETRPLSIYSAVWRTYLTAWYRTPAVQNWISELVLNTGVACGTGAETTEEMIGAMTDCLAESGYAAALDFSQAFDRLHPEISLRVLTKAGFPMQLIHTLRQVWTRQHRIMEFDGERLEHPLETGQATPQGDPFGPLLLAVWMVAATNEIEAQKTNTKKQVTLKKVYVDDRNFTATSAEALLDRKQQWEQ